MNITLNISKKIFNRVYYPYLYDYTHRYNVFYGGAASGKSYFVFQKIVIKALQEKRKVLVIRKVAATLKDSCFQMLLDTLSTFRILDRCIVNKTTMTIMLPNQSCFLLKGLDDSEKIKSIAGITDIICEEATELSIDDVSQLDLRLRARVKHLQMYFMFNPTAKTNWVYNRWFAQDAKYGADTFIIHTTYKDNEFLPQSYIDSIEGLKKTNPTYYKIYALGQFASFDKLVYNNWTIRPFSLEQLKEGGRLCCALDWGFINDPTAFIAFMVYEKEKEIYIFKEFYKSGLTNPQIAMVIKSLGFAKSEIIADSAEQKSIEELKNLGITRIRPSTKGKDSVIFGIQKIQQYKIYVNPECENTILEFENYSYKKDKSTNEYTNEPVDDFNHLMDCLRYGIQIVDGNRKIRIIDKNKLGIW